MFGGSYVMMLPLLQRRGREKLIRRRKALLWTASPWAVYA